MLSTSDHQTFPKPACMGISVASSGSLAPHLPCIAVIMETAPLIESLSCARCFMYMTVSNFYKDSDMDGIIIHETPRLQEEK